jgi:hypothetical protein
VGQEVEVEAETVTVAIHIIVMVFINKLQILMPIQDKRTLAVAEAAAAILEQIHMELVATAAPV